MRQTVMKKKMNASKAKEGGGKKRRAKLALDALPPKIDLTFPFDPVQEAVLIGPRIPRTPTSRTRAAPRHAIHFTPAPLGAICSKRQSRFLIIYTSTRFSPAFFRLSLSPSLTIIFPVSLSALLLFDVRSLFNSLSFGLSFTLFLRVIARLRCAAIAADLGRGCMAEMMMRKYALLKFIPSYGGSDFF